VREANAVAPMDHPSRDRKEAGEGDAAKTAHPRSLTVAARLGSPYAPLRIRGSLARNRDSVGVAQRMVAG